MTDRAAPPVLLRVIRDGAVESEHRGDVAVVDPDGVLVARIGCAATTTYGRSTLKPFQALAVQRVLAEADVSLPGPSLAIATASHRGTSTQQIEAAYLLALADTDETALRCPPALPVDVATLLDQGTPTRLAHNCSGKHAAFLLACAAAGWDPQAYLDPGSPLQGRVREALATACGEVPAGPGVDGCGAPAWRLSLRALATGFARLAAAPSTEPLGLLATAMRRHPDLVGGEDCDDTALMRAAPVVVAKRGAEAVFAAGVAGPRPVGVAVKIADGGARAAGPVMAAVLQRLAVRVPPAVLSPPVLGGGARHGRLQPDLHDLSDLHA
jgi:L-asparaginase II